MVKGKSGLEGREAGAWLFLEIGLAATLHLDCRDWGFSLAPAKDHPIGKQVHYCGAKRKVSGEAIADKNAHERWIQSQ